jgi:hypothetical protein
LLLLVTNEARTYGVQHSEHRPLVVKICALPVVRRLRLPTLNNLALPAVAIAFPQLLHASCSTISLIQPSARSPSVFQWA